MKNTQLQKCPSAPRRNDKTHYGFYGALARRSLASINVPADTVMFTDAANVTTSATANPTNPERWTEQGHVDWEVGYGRVFEGTAPGGGPQGWWQQSGSFRRSVGRHNNTCDVAFVDGHVKAIQIKQLLGPLTGSAPEGYVLRDPKNLWDNY
jgi:prepilin-type processing-associated H-X9-DG protein